MILGTVSASERTAPVQGEQPSERIRHFTVSSRSPGCSGTNGCSGTMSDWPRTITSRSFAKYSGTTGIRSTSMYCQTSISVQFDSGNTRMLSPERMRLFSRCQSSGR